MAGSDSTKRMEALGDVLLVIAVLVIVKQSVLQFSFLFGGPASTFCAMMVATWLLHRRGYSWIDLGLTWPKSWPRTAAATAAVFAAFLVAAVGMDAIALMLFEDIGTSGRFDFIEGNLAGYLLIMALVWTHGSFFEELLFRAFIITKSRTALGETRAAGILAVILAAIFFGYRHYYYQGMHGAIVTGGIGLVFGMIYLKAGKSSLVPLALAHGLANSIAQTQRFLGG